VDLSVLRGTIALVGATAFGIGDVTSTPLASVASGVEVHAQVIAGLLDHRVPHSPASPGTLLALTLLTVSLVLSGLTVSAWGAPARRLPLAGVAMASLLVGASLWALLAHDLWLPWFSAAMFALLAATSLATAEHALTRAQRARLSAHLGSYLPAPVAQRLMTSEPSGTVQAEPRQVTVLVADMRNFSAFASHRPPEQTAALLHAFYCIAGRHRAAWRRGREHRRRLGDGHLERLLGVSGSRCACPGGGARADPGDLPAVCRPA
ncbi:MAG TPA: CHASE2 domain-containing protein, partial [Rubrivivax sp.]|nr:CHASE2 domain-containing protein [Rubrivivax sp.]